MYRLLRPFLFSMDAERTHDMAMALARTVQRVHPAIVKPFFYFEDKRLSQQVWNLPFPNPLGLAAGFDKNAELLTFWQALGFGFVEVGSVSAKPCEGNPRPRSFRLPLDGAIINRMGLNNEGADRVTERIDQFKSSTCLVGVNLAKTHDPKIMGNDAIKDFCYSFRQLARVADYVTLNVSCPNTAEGKTFEEPETLERLLEAVLHQKKDIRPELPVLVKLSPPPSDNFVEDDRISGLVSVAMAHGVDGFVATNTASDRSQLVSPADVIEKAGPGGLSGAPLEERSNAMIRFLYRRTEGRLPIIGVGGTHSAVGAYMKIRAGASLLQIYTGMVYEGPRLIKQIKKDLVLLLDRDGFASIQDAVGVDA